MPIVLLNVLLWPLLTNPQTGFGRPEKPSDHDGYTPEKPRACGIEDVATWGRTRVQSHG